MFMSAPCFIYSIYNLIYKYIFNYMWFYKILIMNDLKILYFDFLAIVFVCM